MDIARTLAADTRDTSAAELLVWAEATSGAQIAPPSVARRRTSPTGSPGRSSSARPASGIHTAGRPSCSDAIPPHAVAKSPSFSSTVHGE